MFDHMWLEIFAEIIHAASENHPETLISRESTIMSKLGTIVVKMQLTTGYYFSKS